MNMLKPAALAILLALGAAQAQEAEKNVEIRVVVSGDGDETSEMHWSGDHMGFELHDMAVGETRTLEDESGKSVTVTRSEDGFDFDIDGKVVSLPPMGEHGKHMAFAGAGGPHENVDVRVMRGGPLAMRAHGPEGITIISREPLDDSVRESIRSVLISAGKDEEVIFIDGSQEGPHVMMRKIEIAE